MPTRVVIIGAGWAGLAAAKTYLQMNPSIHLTILDAQKTLGGVWSEERVYPGLIADSPSGMFDFSDLPMQGKDMQDIQGSKVFEYLSQYADHFHLHEHMRLGVRVVKCTKDEKEWVIRLDTGEEIACDKLIVAAGLASSPNMPDVPRKDFTGPVIHSRDISPYFTEFTKQGEGSMRNVVVYGGARSAIDTIIMCLDAGKEVDWVIREVGQGNGPGLMIEIRRRFGIHPAVFAGRWKNVFSPNIWNSEGWWWRFLQSGTNKFGAWLSRWVWKKISKASTTMGPYKIQSENIKKLIPENADNALFFSTGLSALHSDVPQNDAFIENLHSGKMLRVHRASITSMANDTVHLSDGSVLDNVDGAIFATGWTYDTDMFEPRVSSIPTPVASEDATESQYWEGLHSEADREVLRRLPSLAEAPLSTTFQRPLSRTPFRLYRYILPTTPEHLSSRDLIFLGILVNIQTAMYDEVSALWGIAFLEGLRDVPSKDEMDANIALVNAWCARRYVGRGKMQPIGAVEVQDVIDTMMRDLGLPAQRRSGSLSDFFIPYRGKLYKGIVDDFLKGNTV